MKRRGIPLVISAPSGGGKTTLCRRVMAQLGEIGFSISHTTRDPRGEEKDGIDYHFVDEQRFSLMVEERKFLEWAYVHGQRYGTARAQPEVQLENGIDVLFDVDIQGGQQISDQIEDTVLVFIAPPSLSALEQRLRGRGTDSNTVIEKRLLAAREEIREASFYTYWIINDDLERASEELAAVICAERLKRMDTAGLVHSLLGP